MNKNSFSGYKYFIFRSIDIHCFLLKCDTFMPPYFLLIHSTPTSNQSTFRRDSCFHPCYPTEKRLGGSVNAPPNPKGNAKGVRIRNPSPGRYDQNTWQSRSHCPSKSCEEKTPYSFLQSLDCLETT